MWNCTAIYRPSNTRRWFLLSHQVWQFGIAGLLYVLQLIVSVFQTNKYATFLQMWRVHVFVTFRYALRRSGVSQSCVCDYFVFNCKYGLFYPRRLTILFLLLYFEFIFKNGSGFLFCHLTFTSKIHVPSCSIEVLSSFWLENKLFFVYSYWNVPNISPISYRQAKSRNILCRCVVGEWTLCTEPLKYRYVQYWPFLTWICLTGRWYALLRSHRSL
jgi:hypothetical protein